MKLLEITAVVIAGLLLLPLVVATPALAGPVLTVSPAEGHPGTVVTVTGTGFTPGRSYRVYFDVNGNERYDLGEPYRDVTTGRAGTFTVTLTVPSALTAGTYKVRADVSPFVPPAEASADFFVRTATYDLLSYVKSKVDEVFGGLGNIASTLQEVEEAIVSTIGDAQSAILDAINGLGSTLSEAISGVEQSILSAIETVKSTILNAIDEVKEGILQAVNSVGSKVDELNSKLGDFTNGDTVASLLYEILWTIESGVNDLRQTLDEWFGPEGTYSRTAQVVGVSKVYSEGNVPTSETEIEIVDIGVGRAARFTVCYLGREARYEGTIGINITIYATSDGYHWQPIEQVTLRSDRRAPVPYRCYEFAARGFKITVKAGTQWQALELHYSYVYEYPPQA